MNEKAKTRTLILRKIRNLRTMTVKNIKPGIDIIKSELMLFKFP